MGSGRLLKKAAQQGRSEWRPGGLPCGVRCGPERCENAADGLFQQPEAWWM